MIHARTRGELLRFAATGTLCVALNVIIVAVLTEIVGLPYLASIAVCFFTVTLFGFVMNRRWTFGKQGGRAAHDLVRYIVTTIVNLVISLSLCRFLVERLHVPYAVTLVVVSVAFVPITFVLHRVWSFRMTRLDPQS